VRAGRRSWRAALLLRAHGNSPCSAWRGRAPGVQSARRRGRGSPASTPPAPRASGWSAGGCAGGPPAAPRPTRTAGTGSRPGPTRRASRRAPACRRAGVRPARSAPPPGRACRPSAGTGGLHTWVTRTCVYAGLQLHPGPARCASGRRQPVRAAWASASGPALSGAGGSRAQQSGRQNSGRTSTWSAPCA